MAPFSTKPAVLAPFVAKQIKRGVLGRLEKSRVPLIASIRDEAKFGQRTTFDIPQARLVLMNARIALVQGQYSRVVTTYNLIGAIGLASRLKRSSSKLPITRRAERNCPWGAWLRDSARSRSPDLPIRV